MLASRKKLLAIFKMHLHARIALNYLKNYGYMLQQICYIVMSVSSPESWQVSELSHPRNGMRGTRRGRAGCRSWG